MHATNARQNRGRGSALFVFSISLNLLQLQTKPQPYPTLPYPRPPLIYSCSLVLAGPKNQTSPLHQCDDAIRNPSLKSPFLPPLLHPAIHSATPEIDQSVDGRGHHPRKLLLRRRRFARRRWLLAGPTQNQTGNAARPHGMFSTTRQCMRDMAACHSRDMACIHHRERERDLPR